MQIIPKILESLLRTFWCFYSEGFESSLRYFLKFETFYVIIRTGHGISLTNHILLMSSYKLTLRHIGNKAAIVLLLLINRLLLLCYVLIVGHHSITTAVPEMENHFVRKLNRIL